MLDLILRKLFAVVKHIHFVDDFKNFVSVYILVLLKLEMGEILKNKNKFLL